MGLITRHLLPRCGEVHLLPPHPGGPASASQRPCHSKYRGADGQPWHMEILFGIRSSRNFSGSITLRTMGRGRGKPRGEDRLHGLLHKACFPSISSRLRTACRCECKIDEDLGTNAAIFSRQQCFPRQEFTYPSLSSRGGLSKTSF